MEIQNYPNYLIYKDGKVYSKKSKKFLKARNNGKNYLFVSLCKNGKPKQFYIHRLVGIHYLPNPNDLLEVDHIDRNRLNNDITNLRWISHKHNNHNKGYRSNNKSGIKCIYKNKQLWIYQKTTDKYMYFSSKSKSLVLWCKFIYELSNK